MGFTDVCSSSSPDGEIIRARVNPNKETQQLNCPSLTTFCPPPPPPAQGAPCKKKYNVQCKAECKSTKFNTNLMVEHRSTYIEPSSDGFLSSTTTTGSGGPLERRNTTLTEAELFVNLTYLYLSAYLSTRLVRENPRKVILRL